MGRTSILQISVNKCMYYFTGYFSYLNSDLSSSFRLKDLHAEFKGNVLICLHGTDELPDSLFIECIENGVSKVGLFLFI